MTASAEGAPAREPLSEVAALLLAAVAAALPSARALVPGLSYYFRDFSVTFYPLRLFQARELAHGRLPFWNPYIHEGSFVLPALYPPELLHALWPGPAAVSWLLTLHIPLAAVAAYLFARTLGARREGAAVAGAFYALGGLAASSVNLYVFLQALAWAPAVAAAAVQAARRGGRFVALLALAAAVSLSTMAIEFAGQALLLGLVLGCAAAWSPRAGARLAAGLVLGGAAAAVPLAVTAGFLPETARGIGFSPEVALANELHPVALLQVLVPSLFGSLDAPVEVWWGGRFFSKGFPYFISIYLGAVPLALAAAGWPRLPRRVRATMAALALLALWYALGARAGLAPLLQQVPALRWFRFPSKALLLPYLALVPAAALGYDRLRAGEGWGGAARWMAALAALSALPALALLAAPAAVAAWAALPEWARGRVVAASVLAAMAALAGAALAFVAAGARVQPRFAAPLLALLGAASLARAHAALNPQVSPRFYDPLPEIAALRLGEGGRAFSYGADESPAFRGLLATGLPGIGLWSFFVDRQLLGPYNNMLDGVETADSKDLTSFVPRPPLLEPGEYDPRGFAAIADRLRQASVAHVLSLDPLADPALRERAAVPTGAGNVVIHVYELQGAAARASVVCRADDVALEGTVPTLACGAGRVTPLPARGANAAAYEVEADGSALLVMRERYARGWTARVDGAPAPVLRANGRHRAVEVGAGRHRVELAYAPPGLRAGLLSMAAGLIGILGVVLWPRLL